jgi:hypothetical protein
MFVALMSVVPIVARMLSAVWACVLLRVRLGLGILLVRGLAIQLVQPTVIIFIVISKIHTITAQQI